MVSAELVHNPYLLLTSVKFNGQSPRINSQIEKYEHQPLKDWVKLVPGIFFDELNGYDFDLFFIGTRPDYEEVQKAFQNAGVSDEDVRLIYKNEIEDADTKSAEVESLIDWLRKNRNRKFDFDAFWEENQELFEGFYTYIVIGGTAPVKADDYIGVEVVSSAKELLSTVLTSTPVLFFITNDNMVQIRTNLIEILARKDIREEQLFFMIDPAMNKNQVTRVIEDLGVKNPQVVSGYFDDTVRKYIRNYPITEYIREAIRVYRKVANDIETVLTKENEESITINAGIHDRIDTLEEDITRLKGTDNCFVQRDIFTLPESFTSAKTTLADLIQKWKNRKIKIIGDTEIEVAACEYEGYLIKAYQNFTKQIFSEFSANGWSIRNEFHTTYCEAKIEAGYYPENIEPDIPLNIVCPSVKHEFITLKQITYEETKSDFFGLFKKPADQENEPVRVATGYLEQWRKKAEELILPLAEAVIADCSIKLADYYDKQAEAYHQKLTYFLEEKKAEKEKVTSTLSDEEKKLQQDNDWLAAFKDQLYRIERG